MKICEFCKVEFVAKDYRQRCCSRSCSATMNNLKRGLKPKAIIECIGCGAKLAKHQKKYCSRGCNMKHANKTFIEAWLSGETSGSDANGVLKSACRKYLVQQAGTACTKCGWCEVNPKLGYPILTIDHIDGNWRNNSVDNLVVLCYNCHTLTPTFGALNMGNGAGARGTYDRTSNGMVAQSVEHDIANVEVAGS